MQIISPNNDVVIEINEAISQLTCTFRSEITEDYFRQFQSCFAKPRYEVEYGCNTSSGGSNRQVVLIDFNNGETFHSVAKKLESLLLNMGFRLFLWERLLPGRTRRTHDLEDFAPLTT